MDARDNQGWTPLMFTAQEDQLECAELLLSHGAEVDARDAIDRTALMQAARCGHKQIAERLIASGADIHAQCGWSTPLIIASTAGYINVGEILLDHGANIDELDDRDGYSALMMAAFGGHSGFVELLIEKGADVNQSTEWNVTAVTMARRGGHEDVEEILMQAGAAEPEPVPFPVLLPFGWVGDPILCQQMPAAGI